MNSELLGSLAEQNKRVERLREQAIFTANALRNMERYLICSECSPYCSTQLLSLAGNLERAAGVLK